MGKISRFRTRRSRSLPKPNSRAARGPAIRLIFIAVLLGGAGGYLLFDALPLDTMHAAETRLPASLSSDPIAGRAAVIDGDTIEIRGQRIRLHGIDSPESDQRCMVRGKQARCGQQAAFALADRIDGAAVSCAPRDRDRYGRVVAVCRAQGEDLNAWMVAEGWAMAYREYSADYIGQEESAAAAKVGIWAGEFVAPWKWRRGDRMAAELPRATGDCAIKGNISAKGERIYHVPGGMFYDRTKINAGKGERWFCTEAEARAAGWRRSKR